ncbi:MAG: asparagine synthase (glutamine-hydrolyzing) [bacterium]|nr:asparagine synthase (glutamine-hydrolyzing) [bacterium]
MCGIVGVYHLNGTRALPETVLAAGRLMRHRGPDGEGYLLLNTSSGQHSLRNGPDTPANIVHPALEAPVGFEPDLILGHRRLAILDLSPTGHEPMTLADADGAYWLTFNGEIYNYLELRDELRACGYAFHTECDAEVILQAYRAWGVQCLDRFVGMFAFALWDQPQRQLFCARDRFGVKPFYFVQQRDLFAFASEIKALRPFAPLTPDMDQLAWFLHYGGVYHAPRTFFQEAQELPGGCYLLIRDGAAGQPVQWWDVDLERARSLYNYGDIEGEFLRLMRDSVRLRMRSNVPVGTCLSGGLDSSTIVAFATELLEDGDRMHSFSSLYPVKGLDESTYVRLVSERFHTISHHITPDPADFLAHVERITWHQDIPSATPTVYSQHFVMKLAHGNVTVLLDGQGADELFAGYLSHAAAYLKTLLRGDPLRGVGEAVRFASSAYPRFFASQNWRELSGRILAYARYGRHATAVLNADLQRAAAARQQAVPTRDLNSPDQVNNTLYQSLVRDSIPALLHYEDRNSMAYGIEARVPFLDHRLAEFTLGVPSHQKIRGAETKVFMRRALHGILPEAVVNRKDKLGYPTPFSQWLRGPLHDEVQTYLHDTVLKRGWYDREQVKMLWDDHAAGRRDNGQAIFRLITAEQWYTQALSPIDAR